MIPLQKQTPWNRVLLEKVTAPNLKEFSIFNGIWQFSTTFTIDHHWSPFQSTWIQSTPSQAIYLRTTQTLATVHIRWIFKAVSSIQIFIFLNSLYGEINPVYVDSALGGLCTLYMWAVFLMFQSFTLPPSSGSKWVGQVSVQVHLYFGSTHTHRKHIRTRMQIHTHTNMNTHTNTCTCMQTCTHEH
jgi:hypothetical protein